MLFLRGVVRLLDFDQFRLHGFAGQGERRQPDQFWREAQSVSAGLDNLCFQGRDVVILQSLAPFQSDHERWMHQGARRFEDDPECTGHARKEARQDGADRLRIDIDAP